MPTTATAAKVAVSRGGVLQFDMSPTFSLRKVGKRYGEGPAAIHALRDVDLDVAEGEMLVLLGPSGSGKSTLLNILGGLDRATSGDVTFRNTSLAAMPDEQLTRYRRQHVGFISDEGSALRVEEQRIDVRVVAFEERDVLRVPTDALVRQGDSDWSVFRVMDGRARQTPVSIGDGDDRFRVVTTGISIGDRVVLFPGDTLRDGDAVQVTAR